MFDFVAILGRGIQRLEEAAAVTKVSSWVLTEDLEVCDKNSAHLPVRVPVDDASPYCMVGGGDMNMLAGQFLIEQYQPKLVVCAYGHASDYLRSIGAPTESEVMGKMLQERWGMLASLQKWNPTSYPEVEVWSRTRTVPGVPSNTRLELLNIFDLALERGFRRIAVVTVGVHIPRTTTYISKHQSVYSKYRELSIVPFESEEVLRVTNHAKYGPRVESLRNSQSFARNWDREAIGISKIVRDVYGDAKPSVTA